MHGTKSTLSHFQMLHTVDTSERWRITQVLSINAAVRQLKKEENGLYNCICSILTDAHFVTEVRNRPLPLLPTQFIGRRPAAGPLLHANAVVQNLWFAVQVCQTRPCLPAFANLRCGLWYVPSPTGTCYFKSTDGHTGNWSFSLIRLNLHVALQAATAGGCFVVDATRRGKIFPVRSPGPGMCKCCRNLGHKADQSRLRRSANRREGIPCALTDPQRRLLS